MTPALAELVRRSCLCSDGLCDDCTAIVAALEQGERLRAAIDELKRPLQRYMDGGGGSCDCLDCPEEPGRPICCGTCWYCHGQAAMLQARAALASAGEDAR